MNIYNYRMLHTPSSYDHLAATALTFALCILRLLLMIFSRMARVSSSVGGTSWGGGSSPGGASSAADVAVVSSDLRSAFTSARNARKSSTLRIRFGKLDDTNSWKASKWEV